MIFQGAVEQQPGEHGVPLKNLFGESDEELPQIALLLQLRLQLYTCTGAAGTALLLDDRPIQVFLGGKMAEDNGLIHLGHSGDLARLIPVVSLAREQLPVDFESLLAPVGC